MNDGDGKNEKRYTTVMRNKDNKWLYCIWCHELVEQMGSQTSNMNRHSNKCAETAKRESKKGGDQDDDDDDDEDDDIKMKKKQTKIEQWTIRQQVDAKRWPPEYKTSAKKGMFAV